MMTNLGVLPENLTTNCNDWLEIKLKLKIKGEDYIVPGGNIKSMELDCQYYGFMGALSFSIPDDERKDKIIKHFTKEDLIEIELEIVPILPPETTPPDPLKLKGIVTEKSLREELYLETKAIDVYYRHYKIWFADAAQVLWKQHFPCELYVKESMESVFKKQLTEQIKLEMKLPAMKTKLPMICLGLGLDDRLNNGSRHGLNQASFYDFVLNYVSSHHAHFQYDYKKQSYLITEQRAKSIKSKDFTSPEIASVTTHWEATQRYQIQLLNALADKPKKETVKNKQVVEGMRHDVLMREPVTTKVTDYKEKAKACLASKQELQEIYFSSWPEVTFAPDYAFSIDKKTWGKDPFLLDKKYRAFRIRIKAEIVEEAAEFQILNTSVGYNLLYEVSAEPEASQHPRLPEMISTAYPIQVEGLVVSTVGDEAKKDKTYDLEKNKDTQRDQFKVKIPLWDKTILILEEPDYMHPRFYFPYDRNDKLLIDLYLYKGLVARILDWEAGVKLPQKTQGNHVLFGKNDKDETSMRHIYDGEKPVLHIKRLKEKDNEHIKLKEGTLRLETNWEEQ